MFVCYAGCTQEYIHGVLCLSMYPKDLSSSVCFVFPGDTRTLRVCEFPCVPGPLFLGSSDGTHGESNMSTLLTPNDTSSRGTPTPFRP